jgi:hypothetical protein
LVDFLIWMEHISGVAKGRWCQSSVSLSLESHGSSLDCLPSVPGTQLSSWDLFCLFSEEAFCLRPYF